MSDDKHHDAHNERVLEREPVDMRGASEPGGTMGIGTYLATRLTTLKPPMERVENPIKLLGLLNVKQWLFFWCAFIAWTWDAFDFFTVSLTVSDLAEQFDKSKKDITWGITLVLMFRSVGAITFGLASDRYGRKWPVRITPGRAVVHCRRH
jgi:SHS family lactate transporter-like MFS transporter